MSWIAAPEPSCEQRPDQPTIEVEITGRSRDIGSFSVARVLPAPARRMVGPFVFFDHMVATTLAPGTGMDVRPHPHINLATVTYLFEGEIFHRDSVGSALAIRPGAINWMTAGRGIVHSERTPAEARVAGSTMHGLQLWVAMPRAAEEVEPGFSHHPAETLPELEDNGVCARVLAGSAYGVNAPVPVASPLCYVDVQLDPGKRIEVPREHEERAIYVVAGAVRCGTAVVPASTMAVLRPHVPTVLEATMPTRLVMIGGAPLDGPRYIWWNFVSSSKERIEQAARDWQAGRFPKVPGDDQEFIPLADLPRFPPG
jgi:redox-sensitive bicupin YhaK (pirin superfamily)